MLALYKITDLEKDGGSFRAQIVFDASHPVFAGHFPGRPVVPGVMLVEIATAVISQITGKQLVVKAATAIKFLNIIDPVANPAVMLKGSIVNVDDQGVKADLVLSSREVFFAKMKGIQFGLL